MTSKTTRKIWYMEAGRVYDNEGTVAMTPHYRGDSLNNARLIAEAPDLLFCCKYLTLWTRAYAPDDPIYKKIEGIISRIEGTNQ